MTKGRSGIDLSGSRKKYLVFMLIAFFMVLLLNSPFILSNDININVIKKIRNSNSEHFDPIFVNGNIVEFYPKNNKKIDRSTPYIAQNKYRLFSSVNNNKGCMSAQPSRCNSPSRFRKTSVTKYIFLTKI